MRTFTAALLLATAASAQMTALVNDPMSHGVVGDSKLSLEEAIRIMNTQLAYSALSAAEQAQLRGLPHNVLDNIEVDAAITPVITMEKDFTPIKGDSITHVDAFFWGLNGRPVIDATVNPITEVFPARTNHFHLTDFVVKGGKSGIEYDASLHYHPGEVMTVTNCLFVGQTEVGIQVRVPTFPPGGVQPAIVQDSVFQSLPIGIEVLDQGLSGDTDLRCTRSSFVGCGVGLHFAMTGNAGTVDAIVDRCAVSGTGTGLRVSRPAGKDSGLTLDVLHCDIDASDHGIEIAGDLASGTALALHHSTVRGGSDAGDYALYTTPNNARVDLRMGEDVIHGDVLLQVGRFAQALRIHNSRFEDGSLALETTGPVPDFDALVFDSAPVTVAAATTKTVRFNASEMVRSPVADLTAGGVTTVAGCYLGQSPLTNVANSNPAPSRWIGQAAVTPNDPPVGGFVDLSLDLQPGTAAVWLLSLAEELPDVTAAPIRFYFDLLSSVTLPGQYTLRDSLRLNIPNNGFLSGFELYAQPVVLPTAGQTWAPPFALPAGGRFAIQ